MRVAIDARLVGGTSTGDSTYWTCLLQSLIQLFPEFEFVCISNQPQPDSVPFISKENWHFVPAKSSRWWSLVSFPLAARKLGAQVTHMQYALSPLVRNGVSTVHDVSFLVNPSWFTPRDAALLKAGVTMAARNAKRLITVSETSATEIAKFYSGAKDRVRFAHNACPPWIRPIDEPTAVVLRRRVKVEGKYFLTVGTHWARKNMQLAVQAAEQAAAETGAKLVVTGKHGVDLASPNVIATGYVDTDTLSSLYQAAQLYLAPSFHEGFGIPLLEAMRCGAPVMCGPGGAMPEVAGWAALIMPDYDVDTWAKGIRKLSGDESKLAELRNLGFEREREFTWEASARKHVEIYRELV